MIYCIVCTEDVPDEVFDLQQTVSHPTECGICGLRFSSKIHVAEHSMKLHRMSQIYFIG